MTPPGRDLVLGVMAVRLGYLDAPAMLGCARELLRPGEKRALGDLLMARGLLSATQLKGLEALAAQAVATTHGDAAKTLELMPVEVQALAASMTSNDAPAPTRTTTKAVAFDASRLEAGERVVDEQPDQYVPLIDPGGKPMELGRGGSGRVVLVHDTFMGREVARKELLREKLGSAGTDTLTTSTMEERFLREARLTGQLEHPAVVPVYEVGRAGDGTIYFTMKRVRGQTMFDALRAERNLKGRLKLLPAFLKVCQCVAYAHSKGVVHRDLKPQNVMLGNYDEVYLVDWGLARRLDASDPRSGEFKLAPDITGAEFVGALGTPAYMSPEQAAGEAGHIDERSDVWCLGAVLFELLTGRPPYLAPSPIELVAKIRTEEVPRVRTLAKRAPPELVTVCHKALEKDPRRRYANAEELAHDVKAFLDGRRVAAYTYSPLQLLARFMRKNKVTLVPLFSLVVVLAVAGALAVKAISTERDRARAFAHAFLGDVTEKLAAEPDVLPLVSRLTSEAIAHYERTGGLKDAPRADRLKVARALVRLGDVSQSLSRYDDAKADFDAARPLLDGLLETSPDDEARIARAKLACAEGRGAADRGEARAAKRFYAECVELAKQVQPGAPLWSDALAVWTGGQSQLALEYLKAGEEVEAGKALDESVRLGLMWRAVDEDSPSVALHLSESLAELALLARSAGDREHALSHSTDALARAREAVQRAPGDRDLQENLMKRLLDLGEALRITGEQTRSRALVEESEAVGLKLVRQRPDDVDANTLLVDVEAHLGKNPEAFRRVRHLETLGALASVGEVAVGIAFLAGELEETQRLALLPAFEQRPTALLYRTLAMALLDRPGDALVAARAVRGRVHEAGWMPGQVPQAVTREGRFTGAVRDFARDYDAAVLAGAPDGANAAFDRLIQALEAGMQGATPR